MAARIELLEPDRLGSWSVPFLLAAFEPIPITATVARVHAAVWAGLAARGETVGAHDLWIAATALAHGLDVATDNAEALMEV